MRLSYYLFIALFVGFTGLVGGCASDKARTAPDTPFYDGGDKTDPRLDSLTAEELYEKARRTADGGSYAQAIDLYKRLQTRYPFTAVAIQAQLEEAYANYRSANNEGALAGIDRFIKENPRSERMDYALYLKGLVFFDRITGQFDSLLRIDSTKHEPSDARLAFETFGLLVKQHSNSVYVHDAQQRMVWLREWLAKNELHAINYYARRGANVAVIRRGEQMIEKYQGTKTLNTVFPIMAKAYATLGLTAQAKQMEVLAAANPSNP